MGFKLKKVMKIVILFIAGRSDCFPYYVKFSVKKKQKKKACILQRIMVLEKTLRVPWTAQRSKQSILKKMNPENPLDRQKLKLKLQYSGHLI